MADPPAFSSPRSRSVTLIPLTIHWDAGRTESPLRTVLRAMGGGIVCYLAVDGGSIPLNVGDVSKIANPATASLYGLLAGMFSERVFRLLSDLVDAFLSRLTPSREPAAEASRTELTNQTDSQ